MKSKNLLILNGKRSFVQQTFDSTLGNDGLLNCIMCHNPLNGPLFISITNNIPLVCLHTRSLRVNIILKYFLNKEES